MAASTSALGSSPPVVDEAAREIPATRPAWRRGSRRCVAACWTIGVAAPSSPESCRAARDRARVASAWPAAPTSGSKKAALLFFFSSSRSPARASGARSSNTVGFLESVAPERVKEAARQARFEAVLPAQRFAGRASAPSRPISSPAFMCGLADVSGVSPAERRRDAELIGAGAGREIARVAARHGQPLQRRALAFGHRHDRARQRGSGHRPIDEQHRVDGAGDGGRPSTSPPAFRASSPDRRRRWRSSARRPSRSAVISTSASRSVAIAT